MGTFVGLSPEGVTGRMGATGKLGGRVAVLSLRLFWFLPLASPSSYWAPTLG